MAKLFEMILQNSFDGILFMLIILPIRRLTRNLSKIYVNVLWILLLIELLFTPFVKSPFQTVRNVTAFNFKEKAFHSSEILAQKQISYDSPYASKSDIKANYEYNADSNPVNNTQETVINKVNSIENKTVSAAANGRIHALSRYGLLDYLSYIWIMGMTILTVVFLIQYVRLRDKVSTAVKIEDNVWETSNYDIPFVMPGIPSRIYIPSGIAGRQLDYIIAHERQHIRNLDPLKKCAATVALIIHWFNPFVWLAFSLIGKDIEMYCDEQVLKGKGLTEKKQYSQTILDFAEKASGLSLTMSFSKNNVESRIRHILYSKKPRLIISILLALIVLSCGILFLTAKEKSTGETRKDDAGISDTETEKESLTNKPASGIGMTSDAEETDNEIYADDTDDNKISTGNMTDTDTSESGNEPSAEEQINGDEEEYWEDKLIVGTTFETDPYLSDRIRSANNYVNDWYSFPLLTEDIIGTPKEEELKNAVSLIGETQHFLLYGTSYTEIMIIKTPDNRYVYAEVPFTSNYHVQPVLSETDYDLDGENELAIIIYVIHGTGCSIRTLFMTDKARDGKWYLYQLRESEYLPQIEDKFDTVYLDDGIKLLFDGEYVGRTLPMDDEFRNERSNYKFQAGMQIQIHFIEDRIKLNAELGGYADGFYAGDFTGHKINADIIYLGEGKWELKDFRYSNANIDWVIESALPLYFSGQTQDLKQYYLTDGAQIKGSKETDSNITIIDISYPVDNLDSGKTEAMATVRLDGSDFPCHVKIALKLSDSLTDTWKIAGLITDNQ